MGQRVKGIELQREESRIAGKRKEEVLQRTTGGPRLGCHVPDPSQTERPYAGRTGNG